MLVDDIRCDGRVPKAKVCWKDCQVTRFFKLKKNNKDITVLHHSWSNNKKEIALHIWRVKDHRRVKCGKGQTQRWLILWKTGKKMAGDTTYVRCYKKTNNKNKLESCVDLPRLKLPRWVRHRLQHLSISSVSTLSDQHQMHTSVSTSIRQIARAHLHSIR